MKPKSNVVSRPRGILAAQAGVPASPGHCPVRRAAAMRLARILTCGAVIGLLPAIPAPVALSQSGGPYDLTWSTVDGGGETFSTGGGYSLGGTIGQPDAWLLTGGGYTRGGGFWGGGALPVPVYDHRLYLPLVLPGAR